MKTGGITSTFGSWHPRLLPRRTSFFGRVSFLCSFDGNVLVELGASRQTSKFPGLHLELPPEHLAALRTAQFRVESSESEYRSEAEVAVNEEPVSCRTLGDGLEHRSRRVKWTLSEQPARTGRAS